MWMVRDCTRQYKETLEVAGSILTVKQLHRQTVFPFHQSSTQFQISEDKRGAHTASLVYPKKNKMLSNWERKSFRDADLLIPASSYTTRDQR